jgi:hypothetical protein
VETVPLHEAVRPRGNRDEAGSIGESLHALADWFEENKPEAVTWENVTASDLKKHVFSCKPPVSGHNHFPALRQLVKGAQAA